VLISGESYLVKVFFSLKVFFTLLKLVRDKTQCFIGLTLLAFYFILNSSLSSLRESSVTTLSSTDDGVYSDADDGSKRYSRDLLSLCFGFFFHGFCSINLVKSNYSLCLNDLTFFMISLAASFLAVIIT
jgi:hypothetical protein